MQSIGDILKDRKETAKLQPVISKSHYVDTNKYLKMKSIVDGLGGDMSQYVSSGTKHYEIKKQKEKFDKYEGIVMNKDGVRVEFCVYEQDRQIVRSYYVGFTNDCESSYIRNIVGEFDGKLSNYEDTVKEMFK